MKMEMARKNIARPEKQEGEKISPEVLILCPKCGEPVINNPHKCGEMRLILSEWGRSFGIRPGASESPEYLSFKHIFNEAMRVTGGGFKGRYISNHNEQLTAKTSSEDKVIKLSSDDIEFLTKVLGGYYKRKPNNTTEVQTTKKDHETLANDHDLLADYKRRGAPIDPEL